MQTTNRKQAAVEQLASRILLLTCSLFSLLILNSCIEGEEEVWINPDASGRARIQVTAPTVLFSRFGGSEQIITEAKLAFETSPQIRLLDLSSKSVGSRTTLSGEFAFEDARELGSLFDQFRAPPGSPDKSELETAFGESKVAIDFPNMRFTRKLDIRALVPPEANNRFVQKLTEEGRFQFKIHLPTPVSDHDADLISPDQRTLTWQMSLPELMRESHTMSFTAPVPGLAGYYTLAAALLVLLLALVIFFFKRLRHSKTPS